MTKLYDRFYCHSSYMAIYAHGLLSHQFLKDLLGSYDIVKMARSPVVENGNVSARYRPRKVTPIPVVESCKPVALNLQGYVITLSIVK
jgi:hypothetical protein